MKRKIKEITLTIPLFRSDISVFHSGTFDDFKNTVDEIEFVDPILDCPEECIVIFQDGFKLIVLENPDELWIRINDLKNGIAFNNGEDLQ